MCFLILGTDADCTWPVLPARIIHPGLLLMNSRVCVGHGPSAAPLEAQSPFTPHSPGAAQD